jgi:aminoglycoside/choline kinase family phosphotransferase
MARTMDYLHRNLAHPALEDLAAFVKKHFLDGAPEPGKTAGEKA